MLIRKWLASKRVPPPHSLVIEITSCCNLRCQMCPKTHGEVNTPEDKVMDWAVFERLREIFPFLTAAELSGLWGEALLHPDLYLRMLRELKSFRINVCTTSNGTLLDHTLAEGIVRAQLDRLVISMDAATPETYAQIRTPGSFEDVLAGLRSLKKWKTDLQSSLPRLELAYLGLRRNIDEFPAFVQLAHELGAAKVSLQALGEYERVRGESVAVNFKELGKQRFAEAQAAGEPLGIKVALFPADQFEQDRGPTNTATSFKGLRKDCWDPWSKAVITTNGDVLPCCSATRPLGNLREKKFSEIWHGKGYRWIRRSLKSDRPPEMCVACTGMAWIPRSIRKDLQLATFISGIALNRKLGHAGWYRKAKPILKSIRNRLIGRPVPGGGGQ